MSRVNLCHTVPADTPLPVVGQRGNDGTHRMLLTTCTYACGFHHPVAVSRSPRLIVGVLVVCLLVWTVNKFSGYESGKMMVVSLALAISVLGMCHAVRPRTVPAAIPLLEHVITVVPEELHAQAIELAQRAERFFQANQWVAAHPEHVAPNGHDELRYAANALSNVITAEEWEQAGAEAHLAQAFKGLDLA